MSNLQTMKKIIGLAGVAGCGKDTMFALLQARNPNVKRFALADRVKEELRTFLSDVYKTNIFECSREQKDLVRPMLVSHAKIRRTETNGTYWTDAITKDILDHANAAPENIAVITDIRYCEYVKDEVFWLKKVLNGHLVHLSMMVDGRKFMLAANDEEKRNNPSLKRAADLTLAWPRVHSSSIENLTLLKYVEQVESFINS